MVEVERVSSVGDFADGIGFEGLESCDNFRSQYGGIGMLDIVYGEALVGGILLFHELEEEFEGLVDGEAEHDHDSYDVDVEQDITKRTGKNEDKKQEDPPGKEGERLEGASQGSLYARGDAFHVDGKGLDVLVSRVIHADLVQDSLIGTFMAGIKSLQFCSLNEVLFFHELEGIFDIGIDITWGEEAQSLEQGDLFIEKNL